MAKVVKVVTTIRNNWKKSVFGAFALSYGVNYGLYTYECKQMMRAYCEAAKEIGEAQLPVDNRPRHVTVILNPAANKKKAKKEFEEYCAPLLHLAGLSVDVLMTGKEGQARTLMEKLEEATDAIVVAGGDGTLSEAVTGMLRREDGLNIVRKIPFGVLPLGKTNTVATQLFSGSANDHVKHLAEATMAVILEVTKPLDVIKFQVMPTGSTEGGKPVFGMVGMQWGAFRDANARKDKYWYFAGLRRYATYIFSGLKDENKGMTWNVQAELEYSPPCEGCSNCLHQRVDLQPDGSHKKSWWSAFTKRQPAAASTVDYKGRVNDECRDVHKASIVTSDFSLLSSNVLGVGANIPQLHICIGPEKISYEDFIKEGWRRENGEGPAVENRILAREVKLWPVNKFSNALGATESDTVSSDKKSDKNHQDKWISIDNEDYEVKAIHVTLLPNIIKMFHSPRALVE